MHLRDMVEMKKFFMVIILIQVSLSRNSNGYIIRQFDGKFKYCIPVYDCPPGHQILPCKNNYSKDECVPCPAGTEQPSYISSILDVKSTECFENKNQDKCIANDVQASRTENTNMCDFGKYCECITDQCWYGDPCTCQKRRKPCKSGETMNKLGDCISCPNGTAKAEEGCGPCMHINETKMQRKLESKNLKRITKTVRSKSISTTTIFPKTVSIKTLISTLQPTHIKRENATGIQIMGKKQIQVTFTESNTLEEEESSFGVLVVIVVLLSLLVVFGIVLVVFLLTKRQEKHKDAPQINNDLNVIENGPLLNDMNIIENNDNVVDEEGMDGNGDAPFIDERDMSSNTIESAQANIVPVNMQANVSNKLKTFNHTSLPDVITKIVNEQDCCKVIDEDRNQHCNKKLISEDHDLSPEDFHKIRQEAKTSYESHDSSNVASLTMGSFESPGFKQVTDQYFNPVTQVSGDGPIECHREADDSISSCLENYNFNVKGKSEFEEDCKDSIMNSKACNSTNLKRNERTSVTETKEFVSNQNIPITVSELSLTFKSTKSDSIVEKSVDKNMIKEDLNNNINQTVSRKDERLVLKEHLIKIGKGVDVNTRVNSNDSFTTIICNGDRQC